MTVADETMRVKAVERLTNFIRSHHTGGCRMMSVGDQCVCLLCDVDRIAAAALDAAERVMGVAT